MEFTWDQIKARRNEEKHGVSFAGATPVFADDWASTVRDLEHSIDEWRYLTFGLPAAGRAVVVAHTDRDNSIRIISARLMTPSERRAYERK